MALRSLSSLRNFVQPASRFSTSPQLAAVSRKQSFDHSKIKVEKAKELGKVPEDIEKVAFGRVFTDHVIQADWTSSSGWADPKIIPNGLQEYHPGCMVLHYGLECFEGLKAYYGVDGKIRLFRPELNMARMLESGVRTCFPKFDVEEAIKMLEALIRVDSRWVPKNQKGALYLRPVMIATDPSLGLHVPNEARWYAIASPVGSYFASGSKGVSLLADPGFVRSWVGGVGSYKMGCNYAPTIFVGRLAAEKNCQQVLWLAGEDRQVTEAGAMNVFMFWKNEQGEDELITPPTDSGLILPGVTRRSILELAREWNQFKVTERNFNMDQLLRAIKEKRVYEFFTAGTAAVVGPVAQIVHSDPKAGIEETLVLPSGGSKFNVMKKCYDEITGIQYGRIEKKGWTRVVDV